jgi:hypothetical protein
VTAPDLWKVTGWVVMALIVIGCASAAASVGVVWAVTRMW